jgi:L,D-transpeptidase catalytic domain
MTTDVSRRNLMKFGAVTAMFAACGTALAESADDSLSPLLMRQAMTALTHHRNRLTHIDRIGVVDFTLRSSSARLFIIDVERQTSQSHLVAHGRGSDSAHTGWARRFSNEPGSYASSVGAYVTGAEYSGHHGRSMRLTGLDPENCNAESRAIVVHAAWYVTAEIASRTGMLGRSEGCFAVSNTSLNQVIDRLGPGRLLFAAKA